MGGSLLLGEASESFMTATADTAVVRLFGVGLGVVVAVVVEGVFIPSLKKFIKIKQNFENQKKR